MDTECCEEVIFRLLKTLQIVHAVPDKMQILRPVRRGTLFEKLFLNSQHFSKITDDERLGGGLNPTVTLPVYRAPL